MRAPSLLSIDEGRRGRPDRPTCEGRPARRGSGRGTSTRGDSQHGRPVGLPGKPGNGSNGRRARQESEGLTVLRKPDKASGVGQRPLGIPTIRDRVVETAATLVLEPIFEADCDEAAYGYRPKRSALDAVRAVHKAIDEGHTEIVDADLSKYFDTIPHSALMTCVARRVSDGKMRQLIKMWLKAPVEETDERRGRRMSGGKKATRGTPQGGVISPLLATIYMHRFIKAFRKYGLDRRYGAVLVTYADDFVVLCRHGAAEVLETTRRWMTSIGLALNETKTRVCDARCESFDFLGYTFGLMYSPRTGGRYNGARPSKKALTSIRDKIRRRLRPGNQAPWKEVVRALNRTVRGWAAYFSYGSVSKARHVVELHLYHSVRAFLRRRHKVAGFGCRQFPAQRVFGELGVVSFDPAYRRRPVHASMSA